MKTLRQLGNIKLFFRGEPQTSPDELRVLRLFRNRAEIKKAHGELQKEVYRLKDRIKQQEGVAQRAQEQLAALEARLSVLSSSYPTLVFYQLRRLWRTGRDLIHELVAELAGRQEQHERQQHIATQQRQRAARLEAATQQRNAAEQRVTACNERLSELLVQREQLDKLWHYLKRRRLAPPIAAAQAEQLAAHGELREVQELVEALQKDPLPDFPGLSLEARRAINVRAIAYAELLCGRLTGSDLLRMARDAAACREVNEEYGSREQCEALMVKIDAAQGLLQERANVSPAIRVRTDQLRKAVRYRSAVDTAPTAESLAMALQEAALAAPDGDTLVPSSKWINVLAEDTWDIYKVLLR